MGVNEDMKKIIIFFIIILLLITAYPLYRYFKNKNQIATNNNGNTNQNLNQNVNTNNNANQNANVNSSQSEIYFSNVLDYPIAEFKQRITKKPFGIHITPQNSPVSPERFTGYHTAVDVECQDVTVDVPVYAIADGTVVSSQTASGYGRVFALHVTLTGKYAGEHTIVYGHIRPSTLPKIGLLVKKGEKLAVLGTGYSQETDNERRHLHFGVLSDNRIQLLGYASSKAALSGWVDPQLIYQ